MKILLVGVLDVAWSTNCSMRRTLEKLGHSVVPFNYRTIAERYASCKKRGYDAWFDKAASFLRSGRSPLKIRWYYHRRGRREMNRQLLQTVKNDSYDLILLCKTDSVDFETVAQITKIIPTWYYFMDPMDQALRINAAVYARNSTWASATFSDVAEYFSQKGANRAYWITQGVDAEIFKPQDTHMVYDVVFVGSKTEERTRYIDALLNGGIEVVCFGEGWENKSVYQIELADIYSKSKIVLNLCRRGRGFSIRVFQAMGSGAFLLSEHCPDLESFFKRGEHLDWFKDEAELLNKIRFYLENEQLRNKIAADGCLLVHGKYSWDNIMKNIMNIVQR